MGATESPVAPDPHSSPDSSEEVAVRPQSPSIGTAAHWTWANPLVAFGSPPTDFWWRSRQTGGSRPATTRHAIRLRIRARASPSGRIHGSTAPAACAGHVWSLMNTNPRPCGTEFRHRPLLQQEGGPPYPVDPPCPARAPQHCGSILGDGIRGFLRESRIFLQTATVRGCTRLGARQRLPRP